jgi:primosomal protein N' (replication factor Y)
MLRLPSSQLINLMSKMILWVAVPSPLRKCLAYLPPSDCNPADLIAGIRLHVPLRNKQVCGILVKIGKADGLNLATLKSADFIVDQTPIFPASLMRLINWASDYYHWPIGDSYSTALPALLRQGKPAAFSAITCWQLTEQGRQVKLAELQRAPLQLKVIELLKKHSTGLTKAMLQRHTIPSSVLQTLYKKDWLEKSTLEQTPLSFFAQAQEPSLVLNSAQQIAVQQITQCLGQGQTFLLEGVTGSGKTEVYLQVIDKVISKGQQALILVPEINLTPQTVKRFEQRFKASTVVLHSSLSDKQRLNAWLQAQKGSAHIIIGTRSAIFTPMANPGIIIVDEEHDASYKQQDSFRYCARDLAVMRGKIENIPTVLGTATPCFESLNNVLMGRYGHFTLPERAGAAVVPKYSLIDLRGQHIQEGVSAALFTAIAKHLQADNQVLVFLNRRGYAPVLICHQCGWIAGCKHCSAHLTLHKHLLQCHHCGSQQPIVKQCPTCEQTKLIPLGIGTQRLEQVLSARFPDAGVLRIDRDSTRNKNAMEAILQQVHSKEKRILLGTQMLAKGHHFPDVTLVAILDTDAGLFSADFRASEHLAQLLVQVAGRAGRADKAGEVLIQTYHPDHPLLGLLLDKGYANFARYALQEREQAHLPPFVHLALLRAEAMQAELVQAFMQPLALFIHQQLANVQVEGPVVAPLERKAGHYRMQLLLHAKQRQYMHAAVKQVIAYIGKQKLATKIRWSIDIDPINLL